jgi:hypothetical protein
MGKSRGQRYAKAKYEVETKYESLGEGETSSGQVCPACQGGDSKEASLSVSRRDGVLLFNCHRSSCGFAGRGGGAAKYESNFVKKRSKNYITTTQLNAATIKFLASKFRVPESSLRLAELAWTGDHAGRDGRRISYPIFGPDFTKRGENYRSYQGGVPKCMIHLGTEDAVSSSWYKFRRASKTLVIVEDQMSAIKLAPYVHALALLGTNLSEAKVNEIPKTGPDKYDNIYLCFDNDAIGTAVKTQLDWVSVLPNMRILGLQKDIKDMTDDEFTVFLERLK